MTTRQSSTWQVGSLNGAQGPHAQGQAYHLSCHLPHLPSPQPEHQRWLCHDCMRLCCLVPAKAFVKPTAFPPLAGTLSLKRSSISVCGQESYVWGVTSSFADMSPRLLRNAKWFWMMRKLGLPRPFPTALVRLPAPAKRRKEPAHRQLGGGSWHAILHRALLWHGVVVCGACHTLPGFCDVQHKWVWQLLFAAMLQHQVAW